MRLGVMQPYFFPYIGYFQLIKHVDKYIFYDDVTYIKNGWIDRNRILINGNPHYFKVPLDSASSHRKICDTNLNIELYDKWVNKFLKQLGTTYSRAPYFKVGMDLVEGVLFSECTSIGDLALLSVKNVAKLLKIQTIFLQSSRDYMNSDLERSDRLINFCKMEGCLEYINNYSGSNLYSVDYFAQHNIDLKFLSPFVMQYRQKNSRDFVAGLSIIDLIMNVDVDEIIINHLNCAIT
jgi:hypothetical protein